MTGNARKGGREIRAGARGSARAIKAHARAARAGRTVYLSVRKPNAKYGDDADACACNDEVVVSHASLLDLYARRGYRIVHTNHPQFYVMRLRPPP